MIPSVFMNGILLYIGIVLFYVAYVTISSIVAPMSWVVMVVAALVSFSALQNLYDAVRTGVL